MSTPAAPFAALTDLPTDLVPLSEEQTGIVRLTRRFATREIRPLGPLVDENDGADVPWELWHKAARVGITAFMLPEEYGGGGFTDVFSQCLVQEELCFGDPGLGNLLASNGFFADPVLALGTDEQKKRYLTPLTGERPPMTALAVTEPDVGSDAAALTTRAEPVAGGYRLRGRKTWISNGGVASFYVVFATVEPGARSRGVTAFVVPSDAPGLSWSEPFRKMGQRAIRNTEVVLDDVFVPDRDRLGAEGQGFRGLMHTFDISRTVLGAAALGVARAATEYATAYARERVQFGVPIIEHQAVGFRLADMATRLESSRLLVWRAARRLDAGLPATREAAMAKLAASETATFCTWAAVQTLGGWGYSRDCPVEQWMRDARLEEIEEGTSDIQRLLIARDLAAGRPRRG